MKDYCSVNICGRMIHDPIVKQINDKTSVAEFTVSIKNKYNNKISYIPIDAWGKLAQTVKETVKKGDQITIVGSLKQDRWEENGQQRKRLKVVANQIKLEEN